MPMQQTYVDYTSNEQRIFIVLIEKGLAVQLKK